MTTPVAPLLSSPPVDSRSRARTLLMGLQDSICSSLAAFDGEGQFQEESWVRPEGGGGRSRVMKAGRIFEQGGVNFSEVEGDRLPPSILSQRPEAEGQRVFVHLALVFVGQGRQQPANQLLGVFGWRRLAA